MKTVLLSAGHSLSDPGAVYDAGTRENFLTIRLVAMASDILRRHGIGILTVPDDLSLEQTIQYVNDRAEQITVAVEVHINADSRQANGCEAWYFHNFATGQGDAQSMKVSQCLVDAISAESGMSSRGIKDESTNRWGKLGFVHDTVPLAALVECGFIDGSNDLKLLTTEEGRYKIAKGIARGLLVFMGEQWRPDLLQNGSIPVNITTGDDKDKIIEDLKRLVASVKTESEERVALVTQECQAKLQDIKNKLLNLGNSL